MRIFIWQEIEKVSKSYHSGGGMVVIADSLEDARSKIKAEVNEEAYSGIPSECEALTKEPDVSFELSPDETAQSVLKYVYTFPDAGCC